VTLCRLNEKNAHTVREQAKLKVSGTWSYRNASATARFTISSATPERMVA
jgi:hypothetical protein